MNRPCDELPPVEDSRFERILGIGVRSVRKNYYPELRSRMAELERFRALFDHGNDLIVLAELPSERIADANQPICDQLGYGRDQLVGRCLANILPPDALDAIRHMGADSPTLRLDTLLLAADGDQFVVEMTARVLSEPGGSGVLMVFRDVSQQLLAKAQLAAACERAERASIAKSRFLAAASHDLRQPFQAMTLFQELLAARLQDPTNKRVLSHLTESIKSGQDLLNALLDVSTLDAGIIQPSPGPVRLDDLIRSMEHEFAVQVAERRKTLRLVPSAVDVTSDSTLLARIVRNLIINALKYTGENGKVLVGCRRRGNHVRLMVVDNGPGIPPDKHEEIFEEFTQLQNPERDRKKGLGLGLAIVARMARLLGHEVGVLSRLGHGSTFYIDLPVIARRDC